MSTIICLKIKFIYFLVLSFSRDSISLPSLVNQLSPCSEVFSYQSASGKRDGILNLPENLKNQKLLKLQVEFTIPVKLQTVRFKIDEYLVY